MEDLFIKASRLALRFSTTKGDVTTEELWGMSLTSLDTIAKNINKQLKAEQEESFIKTRSNTGNLLQLKLDIIVYVINTKLTEVEESKIRSEKLAHKQLLLELKANKQMQALQSLSLEDIDKQLAELG